MNAAHSPAVGPRYTFAQKPQHNIHASKNVQQFCSWFEQETGRHPSQLVDDIVLPEFARAIFVVGSIPMGLATSISDIDFVVIVDSKDALAPSAGTTKNNDSALAFSNSSDPLSVGHFIRLINGIEVDINVVLGAKIAGSAQRLKRPGPELSDGEVLTLGRLKKGWLISKTEGFIDAWNDFITDPSLEIFCATRYYWMALKMLEKSKKSASLGDLPVALYFTRLSVESGYLSYFASRGFCAIGTKWLKFVSTFDFDGNLGSKKLFNDNISLAFPGFPCSETELERQFVHIADFLKAARTIIEIDTRFKIAFAVCPQIYNL